MPDLKLGDRVRFTDTVVKDREKNNVTWASAGLPKLKDAWQKSTDISEGVVVGQRFLTDYVVDSYMESEGGGEYGPFYSYRVMESTPVKGSSRKAWLVAWNLRRKPVLVLDTAIEALHAQ